MKRFAIPILALTVFAGFLIGVSKADLVVGGGIFSGDNFFSDFLMGYPSDQIDNRFCSVSLDPPNHLTLRSGGRVVLISELPRFAKTDGYVWRTLYAAATDFGDSQKLQLPSADGQTECILWDKTPFLTIQKHITNDGKKPLILNKVPIFKAKFAASASEKLKILGTGGLTKPGKRIGSYMWLAAGRSDEP